MHNYIGMLFLKVYQQFDVILSTVPLVPYTVGVQAFTHVGGGITENQTMFTQGRGKLS